jgi:hypothetical protein
MFKNSWITAPSFCWCTHIRAPLFSSFFSQILSFRIFLQVSRYFRSRIHKDTLELLAV